MKSVLVFPPGWMQFGPYLSLPLLKGYLESKGIEIDILDLNIEFYDWVLSSDLLQRLDTRLITRESDTELSIVEYAKVCKARLTFERVCSDIEQAKEVIRTPELYVDTYQREWAKKTIGEAINIVESSFDKFSFSLNQIHFGLCGLIPHKVQDFLTSDQNVIKLFYEEKASSFLKGYDFIGFSLPAWEQLVPSLTIINGIRQCHEQVHICMGGNYITRLVGTWGQEVHPFATQVDSFSLFEGEESLHQLLLALSDQQTLQHVPNLVFKDNGKLVSTPIETLDVNTIPTPNFHGFPLEKYFCPETILPLYTSRSCPYKCAFCTIPYASSQFRQRDAAKVVDDIENLSNEYRVQLFTFVDETFTVPNLNRVSKGILARNLNVKWYGETRFSQKITRQLAKQAFDAGCRKLQFGLESYNQRVLDLMRKGTRVEHIQPNIEACLAEGIAVHLFTFLGFPGETKEEAHNTCTFSRAMMNLSEEKYENSFSTVGMGAFGLEVYSDVYYHPERYGVTYNLDLKNSTGDEIFELEYQVQDGLDHKEAEAIVNEFQKKTIYDELCRKTVQVSWHTLAQKETNEEEAFLLYHLLNSAKLNQINVPDIQDSQYICADIDRCTFQLAATVVHSEFSHDFLSFEQQSEEKIISFYHSVQDMVINVPASIGREILDLTHGKQPGEMSHDLLHYCDILLRNGLLQGSGDGIASYMIIENVPEYERNLIKVNPDYLLSRRDDGTFTLFNVVTHEILLINTTVAWIFSLLKRDPHTIGRALDTIIKDSALHRPQVELLFLQFIQGRVFLVHPATSIQIKEEAHAIK